MPTITFITPDGKHVDVSSDAPTIMEAAVEHGVDGIDAECGGVCSCATCHVHVDPAWLEKTGSADPAEQALLLLEDDANEQSRLSCQIPLSEALEGLVVKVVGR